MHSDNSRPSESFPSRASLTCSRQTEVRSGVAPHEPRLEYITWRVRHEHERAGADGADWGEVSKLAASYAMAKETT